MKNEVMQQGNGIILDSDSCFRKSSYLKKSSKFTVKSISKILLNVSFDSRSHFLTLQTSTKFL